jgi:hypothetical protein
MSSCHFSVWFKSRKLFDHPSATTSPDHALSSLSEKRFLNESMELCWIYSVVVFIILEIHYLLLLWCYQVMKRLMVFGVLWWSHDDVLFDLTSCIHKARVTYFLNMRYDRAQQTRDSHHASRGLRPVKKGGKGRTWTCASGCRYPRKTRWRRA